MRIDISATLKYEPEEYEALSIAYLKELKQFSALINQQKMDNNLLNYLLLKTCDLGLSELFLLLSTIKFNDSISKSQESELAKHLKFVENLTINGIEIKKR